MYQKILVPLDGGSTAERGLREAITLAAGQKAPATLHLLHVVDAFPLLVEMAASASSRDTIEALHRYGQDVLEKAAAQARAAGVEATTRLREVPGGRVADAILEETASADCQLVVMGTHGRRGLSRVAMGSDAELVLRGSAVPVLIVRHPGKD